MDISVAHVHIKGITPLSQSRKHNDPMLNGESHEDYEARTWASKLTTELHDGKYVVVIPAHGVHQSLAAAAKYSKIQIPGQGKATWTAKFEAGVALLENPIVMIGNAPIIADEVDGVWILCNADGVRGSGKRVMRKFPVMPEWETRFDVQILDPIITRDVFKEMIGISGMFKGIGRFRPEKGGTNGRFRLVSLGWTDNRSFAEAA